MESFFPTKLLSRLSQKISRLIFSPGLLRKFTIVIQDNINTKLEHDRGITGLTVHSSHTQNALPLIPMIIQACNSF